MGAAIIDGKALGREIEDGLSRRVRSLAEKGVRPHLAVIIVGDDPASHVYVRNKQRACERIGIVSTRIDLTSEISQEELISKIQEFNEDESVHGILVQSPLPEGIDEISVVETIDPAKDVDGFHPSNLGRIVMGDRNGLVPCTPSAVMEILRHYGPELEGKRAVVIGRSRIVGMPLSILLAQKGADTTVTIAHSKTGSLGEICRGADILIAAVGRAEMVKSAWIKPGSTVIDVGINRINDDSRESGNRLVGDVEEGAKEIAGRITPVPGGVGPMTIAMLMSNTVLAAERGS
ncbi:MAG: bifunctional methylenetetrahydrofolate dehydrogenase/methenyltetrahydrofolate cyclohydrolase FolD [Euryarchaeota archaeon]|nr:bifunctional methylenetetrahydrofolate dehydrogenase/methenyltetrahydrofolate cyclohydrolase FolD [Euryarchaeota archaeon]|tara:strand:- start:22836 stop:23708 length:873 start_codon:yes stop_codon:yes gene_type:complete